MQNKFNILLIILVIIVVFGLGWYFSRTQAPKGEQVLGLVLEEEIAEEMRPGWVKYESVELGLSFEYPQEYGQVVLDIKPGTSGLKSRGHFSASNAITFGGISENFALNGEGDDLFIRNINEKYYPYRMYLPREETAQGANITGRFFTQIEPHPDMFYSQGTMLAAFPLSSSANFNAIAFLTSSLSPEEFKDFLSTIIIR